MMVNVKTSLYLLSLSLTVLADTIDVLSCSYDFINSKVVIRVRDISVVEAVFSRSANCARELDMDGILIVECEE